MNELIDYDSKMIHLSNTDINVRNFLALNLHDNKTCKNSNSAQKKKIYFFLIFLLQFSGQGCYKPLSRVAATVSR